MKESRLFSAIRNRHSRECQDDKFFLLNGQDSVAFYFGATEPWDWTVPRNDDLWRDGTKTLFDPCPAGWRVPRSGEAGKGSSPWDMCSLENGEWSVTGTLSSFRFDNTVVRGAPSAFYPITGLRTSISGRPSNLNAEGGEWSTTISAANSAMRYGFGLFRNSVEPARTHHRGHGISVRCVRL